MFEREQIDYSVKPKRGVRKPLDWNFIGITSMSVGMLALVLISVSSTWIWATGRDMGQAATLPAPNVQIIDGENGSNNGGDQEIINLSETPTELRLVFSKYNGDMNYTVSYHDGARWHDVIVGPAPQHVAISPDAKTLAFTVNGVLMLQNSDGKRNIQTPNRPIHLQWSADGEALLMVLTPVVNGKKGDSLYRWEKRSEQLIHMANLTSTTIKPLSHPGTGQVLYTEVQRKNSNEVKTTFYMLDPSCTSPEACLKTRRVLVTLPLEVEGADYHPSGTSIIFASKGEIYLLQTASREFEPYVIDGLFKKNPTFSPDGKWIAFITDKELYAMHIDRIGIATLWQSNILEFDWADDLK